MRSFNLIGIAAVSENGVIGAGNRLPWNLPADLAWFKSVTLGNTIVMGRATLESIGRPLPGRTTYVLTRSPKSAMEISSIDAIQQHSGKVFLCGGSEVYARYLFECDELLITRVFGEYAGDKYFPYFAHRFERAEIISETADFRIERYIKKHED